MPLFAAIVVERRGAPRAILMNTKATISFDDLPSRLDTPRLIFAVVIDYCLPLLATPLPLRCYERAAAMIAGFIDAMITMLHYA